MPKKKRSISTIFKGDKVIWMIFLFLCLISVVEVYSASSTLSYQGGAFWAPILKHIGTIVLGLFGMIIALNIDCKYYKIVTLPLLILAVFTLVWVLVAGQATNGASRWVNFVGIQFQPSEIAKGALVLAVAQILSAMQTEEGADKKAFQYILCVSIPLLFLIMLENLSTAVLLGSTVFCMMVVGRVPGRQIMKLLAFLGIVIVFVFVMVMAVGSAEPEPQPGQQLTEQVAKPREEPGMFGKIFHRASTWKSRVLTFFDKDDLTPADVDLDKDGQRAHANIAIASSNVIGKGPGNSVERDFLSQAFSDFIYAIIIEELGLEGGLFVLMLYIFLLFRTAKIARRCENCFPAYLIMGLALLLVTQAMFNMMVAVGLAPVTGQPLPLISKGGTSTVINCVYLGIMLSVSRSAKKKALPSDNAGAPLQTVPVTDADARSTMQNAEISTVTA